MVTILCLIGLVAALWFMGKILRKAGFFLEQMGEDLIRYATSEPYPGTRKKSNSIKDRIRSIKGEDDYERKIREEINYLTR